MKDDEKEVKVEKEVKSQDPVDQPSEPESKKVKVVVEGEGEGAQEEGPVKEVKEDPSEW